MSAIPDSTLVDPKDHLIADLQRQLAERKPSATRRWSSRPRPPRCLQVINSSPGDLAPVFDAMLEKATRLCEASFGNLYTYDGELLRAVAVHGDARLVEWLGQLGPFRPAPGQPIARLLDGEPFLRVTDLTEDEAYLFQSVRFVHSSIRRGSAVHSLSPCAKTRSQSVCYIFIARKSARSPTNRSHCCRTSRRKRSSRWRTRGCSANYANDDLRGTGIPDRHQRCA